MVEGRIRGDIEYLSGALAHRGSNTHSERKAAEYVHGRLREYTSNVELDDFASITSPMYLLAASHAEFVFIALIAHWFPWFAFGYGTLVLLAYLAEMAGYRTFSRLLPHYETQNVIARFEVPEPHGLVVVTAHYDTGKVSSLSESKVMFWIPWAHRCVVLCMICIIAFALARGLGLHESTGHEIEVMARWTCALILGATAVVLARFEQSGRYARGANDNASGVAALLALAERITEKPFRNCDVILLATGSKEAWLNGIRHFLVRQAPHPRTTVFINLDKVGKGALRLVVGEGTLHTYTTPSRLVKKLRPITQLYKVPHIKHRGWPTDLLIPLVRGFYAVGITAVPEMDVDTIEPDDETAWRSVDSDRVRSAADFAYALLGESINMLTE